MARWVYEVYGRSFGFAEVLSPHRIRTSGIERLYDAYDNAIRIVATVVSRFVDAPYAVVHRRLTFKDWLWKRIMVRRAKSADIVHIHNRPDYVEYIRRSGYSGKVVLHMHNSLRGYVSPSGFAKISGGIDLMYFCSSFLLEEARDQYLLPRSRVLSNGVDLTVSKSAELGVSSRKKGRLIFAGRLVPEKGAVEAVEIVEEVLRRGYDIELDMYGASGLADSNPTTSYVRRLAAVIERVDREWPGRVRMRGPIAHADLMAEFAASDALLLPCGWDEPFGMVAIEAMSVGLVPIVSARGALPDVVAGGGVPVSFSGDDCVANFVPAVLEMLDLDEAASLDMRERARVRARDFSWDHISADMREDFSRSFGSTDLIR